MPITRRRRVNPPDQPETTTNPLADQTENTGEPLAVEQPAVASEPGEEQKHPQAPVAPVASVRTENVPAASAVPPAVTPAPVANGERMERGERHEYIPAIEGGRRTARGELFRRPPQPPTAATVAAAPVAPSVAPLQPPTHEISLPLGNLLHLAYNPGYTGSDEARSELLQKLASESKAGGRARCWSCGSLAIAYDRWNTRSKTFGEVGVAFCEICGVWSVM